MHSTAETLRTIVLIGPAYPYRGGNALFMSYLYEALIPYFRVHLINYTLLYPTILFPGTTQFDKSNTLTKVVPSERLLHSIYPPSWWRVARRIRELSPHLVAFDWWNPFFALSHYTICSLLGKAYKHKTLFITENVVSHEGRRIDTVLTALGLSRASAFLALSEQVARDLTKFARGRPIYCSELPVFGTFYAQTPSTLTQEAAKARLGFAPDVKLLLFFGYVRPYKGLDVLLRAMPFIIQNDPQIKLLVAGEFYDNPRPYEHLVHTLGIHQHVRIINSFIPNEEVAQYYTACDAVVLPYKSATQSGVVGIAYGFERPVIVTNVGGLAESVEEGKTGFIVPPESPRDLAAAVQKLYAQQHSTDYAAHIRSRAQRNAFGNIHTVFSDIIQHLSSM
ncbi:MAG: glycosyltransferase [Bacteroidota bacterium]|nr:glycosyltransferase [Candidatus Kapabacteria bacterium]MDW8220068.1 glycosyltransferase [Bacteroidota bacterium]